MEHLPAADEKTAVIAAFFADVVGCNVSSSLLHKTRTAGVQIKSMQST